MTLQNLDQLAAQSYFFFNNKLFYNEEGNLIQWTLTKKVVSKAKKEYNFKSAIKDFYMTDADTIYYKDKNNMFKFANIRI